MAIYLVRHGESESNVLKNAESIGTVLSLQTGIIPAKEDIGALSKARELALLVCLCSCLKQLPQDGGPALVPPPLPRTPVQRMFNERGHLAEQVGFLIKLRNVPIRRYSYQYFVKVGSYSPSVYVGDILGKGL